jgi:hypothetical protein
VTRRTSTFNLILTFFGLSPETRGNIFRQIHEIVFHGQGGYDWEVVYNMPVWLRRFTFSTLQEHYDKLNADNDDELKPVKNSNKISPPDIVQKAMTPTYSTKASSK